MDAHSPEFAVMVFEETSGAERAYAAADAADAPWARELAFVEHHRRDRIVVRGTIAGHYVDADDELQFVGARTAEGVAAGAAAGLLFGPAGLAAGMVAGGMAGGVAEEHAGPRLRGALFDEVRGEVAEGSSALIMFAASGHVDAMVQAMAGHGGRLVRHVLTPHAADAIEAAVADSPSASPSRSA
jgi:uncharacterized membrane protein